MKRLLILFTCLLTYLGSVNAVEVSESKAIQKAKILMPTKKFLTDSDYRARRGLPTRQNLSKPRPFYIFNAEDEGFVIVAGDDRVSDILAYSEHGSLDLSTAPSNVKWWLDYYENAITSIMENEEELANSRVLKSNIEERNEILPLITTTWGQGEPYNKYCPTLDGKQCLTGSVATAMAQIMHYWAWPIIKTPFIEAYTTSTNNIYMPKLDPDFFNWINLSMYELQRLMLYCGQSVKMDYGTDVSRASALNIANALAYYFDYSDYSNISSISREAYTSSEWENIIYDELQNGRPVIYCGQSDSEDQTFICCGYQEGKFYINWGWDGLYDGYFELSLLKPMNKENEVFSSEHMAIIGIEAPDDEDFFVHPDSHLFITLNKLTREATIADSSIDSGSLDGNSLVSPVDENYNLVQTNFWKHLVIPETVRYKGRTYTVTAIGSKAFNRTTQVETITLPPSIRSIGDKAFNWCVNLKAITMSNNVRYIGSNAFTYCRDLEYIDLPDSLESIGYGAFSDCRQLKEITIPKKCLSIGSDAFMWCRRLTKLIIEDSDKPLSLGYNYDISCDYDADFYGGEPHYRGPFFDSGLTTIYLGRNVDLPSPDGMILSPFGGDGANSFYNWIQSQCVETSSKVYLEIGEKVTSIPDNLLGGKTIVNKIELPSKLENIGYHAFYRALNQEELIIPATVTSIGKEAFYNLATVYRYGIGRDNYDLQCWPLRNIYCKSHIPPSTEDSPFGDCAVYVPSGTGKAYREAWGGKIVDPDDDVVTINVRTPGTLYSRLLAQDLQINDVYRLKLKGTPNDEDWNIVNSMPFLYDWDLSELNKTEFPKRFFWDRTNLLSLKLPDSLTEVCDSAFYGCSYLTGVIPCPSACTNIGNYAFQNTAISKMTFSNPVNIGKGAFMDCYDFECVTIPTGSNVGEDAFLNSGIKEAIIEDGVNTIESLECEKVRFEGVVESIGNISAMEMYAPDVLTWLRIPTPSAPHLFINEEPVTDITIPSEIKFIKDGAFKNCETLNSVMLTNGLKGIGNNAFSKCSNLKDIAFPPSVNTIGNEAFSACINLQEVSLPSKLTTVNSSTFSDCTGLKIINFSPSLEIIGNQAFTGCTGLTKLNFPPCLTKIGEQSFSNCSDLREIDIPESVNSIGSGAFKGGTSINTIVAHWDDPITITEDVFPNVSSDCFLYIPIGTSTKYFNAGWNILPKLKEAGIMDISLNIGGRVVYSEETIENETKKIFFTPYKSFILSFEPSDGYSLRKVYLNGQNITSEVEDGELFIEEPEENMNIKVVFADNSIVTGDANGDGVVNITDAICVVNHVLKKSPIEFYDYAADVNDDDVINVTDAISIIHRVLKNNPSFMQKLVQKLSLQ